MNEKKYKKLDLAEIDVNMTANVTIDKTGLDFYDIDSEPFRIYGVYRDGEKYRRLPEDEAYRANNGIGSLHANTAGGRVRFTTNSRRIAMLITLGGNMPSDNGAYLNKASIDVYVDGVYHNTTRPGLNYPVVYYESLLPPFLCEEGEHLITLYMPNYGEVHKLVVGLDEGSSLGVAPDYTYEKPVVFYGSSITQGGCASRPGLAYESMLERRLDTDYINLGFSGSAHGEFCTAEYISKLPMSVFVCDYDYNARSEEELQSSHEPFFKKIREENPDLPIIIITKPKYVLTESDFKRAAIIRRTYDNAVAAGDKNVYFIYGGDFFTEVGGEALCDACHPNDLGFLCMANKIYEVLKPLLEK